MTKFPPSLSRIRTDMKSSDRRTGHIERLTELVKKRDRRVAVAKDAMKRLPLKSGAEEDISKMVGLFEQTYSAVQREIGDSAATTRTMEDELNVLAKGLKKVADHVESLHPDTLQTWEQGTRCCCPSPHLKNGGGVGGIKR